MQRRSRWHGVVQGGLGRARATNELWKSGWWTLPGRRSSALRYRPSGKGKPPVGPPTQGGDAAQATGSPD